MRFHAGMMCVVALLCGILQAAPVSKPKRVFACKMDLNALKRDKQTQLSKARWFSKPWRKGSVLRFDGSTTFLTTAINADKLADLPLTFSLWCAPQTYPMMVFGGARNEFSSILGNMKQGQKSGFALALSSFGDWGFECYVDGEKEQFLAEEKLLKGQWVNLRVLLCKDAVQLYQNGRLVGDYPFEEVPDLAGGELLVGKSNKNEFFESAYLNVFNGLIAAFEIYRGKALLSAAATAKMAQEHQPDFGVNADTYEDDIYRPRLHPMPEMAWTNECHALCYYKGRYHLFFQKNANGVYLSRIHWGHLSSPDLCLWEEEPIALAPDMPYDFKGVWSGCVWQDTEATGGVPRLVYTGVDLSKASICMAEPADESLLVWKKDERNPLVPQRPEGLSNDFRDPHMFRYEGEHYMIVGTGKDGIGAVTQHRYDAVNKSWSNTGEIFFNGESIEKHGIFWEMPTIMQMSEDKWLFTATPLGAKAGVEVMYWVGTLNKDACFEPLPAYAKQHGVVELDGMSSEGFGMLSPSLLKLKDGRVAALGIVPDKLPFEENMKLGWAHCYSLTRLWSLDDEDRLVQQPLESLKQLRSKKSFSRKKVRVAKSLSLAPVEGRMAEVEVQFELGQQEAFGLHLFKKGDKSVRLYYQPASNELVLDASGVERIENDMGMFDGEYRSKLPDELKEGDHLKLHLFIDHSILDVFINDKWAFSTRLFPNDPTANEIELFTEQSPVVIDYCRAWMLARPKPTKKD